MHTQFLCQKGAKTLIHAVFPLRVLDENATVGERIRFYRQKRDMSCNTLAAKCGLSRHEIMRYEGGTAEPGLDTLKQIADVLGVNPDNLFDDYYRFLDYPYSSKMKELRKKMQLTQREFGDLFCVNRKTVERWENGDIIITRIRFMELKNRKL